MNSKSVLLQQKIMYHQLGGDRHGSDVFLV